MTTTPATAPVPVSYPRHNHLIFHHCLSKFSTIGKSAWLIQSQWRETWAEKRHLNENVSGTNIGCCRDYLLVTFVSFRKLVCNLKIVSQVLRNKHINPRSFCPVTPLCPIVFCTIGAVLSISRRGINCFLRVTRANCSFCDALRAAGSQPRRAKKRRHRVTIPLRNPYGRD